MNGFPKWFIVAVVGLLFGLIFFSGSASLPSVSSSLVDLNGSFLDLNDTPDSYLGQAGKVPTVNLDENGLVFLDVNGGGGGFGDTNQVKVSGNDTTPGYLEDKISAGSNITLTVLNDGGNEQIEISSTASGGGGNGRTYTSGSPNSVEVNNDLNTISQNFDGNFQFYLAQALPLDYDVNVTNKPYIPTEQDIDGNALAVINSLDLNNSLDYVETTGDTMTGQLLITGGLQPGLHVQGQIYAEAQGGPTSITATGEIISRDIIPAFPDSLGLPSQRWGDFYTQSIGSTGTPTNDIYSDFIESTDLNILDTLCIQNDCRDVWPSSIDTNCSFNDDCVITGTIDTNMEAFFGADINGNQNFHLAGIIDANSFQTNTSTGLQFSGDVMIFCVDPCPEGGETGQRFSTTNRSVCLVFANTDRACFFMGAAGTENALFMIPRTINYNSNAAGYGRDHSGSVIWYEQITGNGNIPDGNYLFMRTKVGNRDQYVHWIGDIVSTQTVLADLNFSRGQRTIADLNVTDQNNLRLETKDLNRGVEFYSVLPSGSSNVTLRVDRGGRTVLPGLRFYTGPSTNIVMDVNELVLSSSSIRYKINIRDLNLDIDPEIILQLQPRCWEDRETLKTGCGFIAEEVFELIPEVVILDQRTGEPTAIDYAMLSNIAISTLQERERKIVELENRLNSLTSEICGLAPTLPSCQTINQPV